MSAQRAKKTNLQRAPKQSISVKSGTKKRKYEIDVRQIIVASLPPPRGGALGQGKKVLTYWLFTIKSYDFRKQQDSIQRNSIR